MPLPTDEKITDQEVWNAIYKEADELMARYVDLKAVQENLENLNPTNTDVVDFTRNYDVPMTIHWTNQTGTME